MFHNKIYLYIAIVLCILPNTALAAGRDKVALSQSRPLSWNCIVDAAHTYNLPLAALVGILATEGGKTGEALSNTNGTWDLGMFQVNTCHIKDLLKAGMSPSEVLRDGCTNAFAAAFILRKEYDRTKNIWDAVGAYHSRTPHLRDAYLGRVKKHLTRLQRTGLTGLVFVNMEAHR